MGCKQQQLDRDARFKTFPPQNPWDLRVITSDLTGDHVFPGRALQGYHN